MLIHCLACSHVYRERGYHHGIGLFAHLVVESKLQVLIYNGVLVQICTDTNYGILVELGIAYVEITGRVKLGHFL